MIGFCKVVQLVCGGWQSRSKKTVVTRFGQIGTESSMSITQRVRLSWRRRLSWLGLLTLRYGCFWGRLPFSDRMVFLFPPPSKQGHYFVFAVL